MATERTEYPNRFIMITEPPCLRYGPALRADRDFGMANSKPYSGFGRHATRVGSCTPRSDAARENGIGDGRVPQGQGPETLPLCIDTIRGSYRVQRSELLRTIVVAAAVKQIAGILGGIV
jgi:hypothetical protein